MTLCFFFSLSWWKVLFEKQEKMHFKKKKKKAYLHCFHGEPDSSQFPPGYFISRAAWLRTQAESFPSVIFLFEFELKNVDHAFVVL